MKSSAVVNVPDVKKYLNRDGLDEYNSLLPHSSAEMQTYVNDWLDEHPEASTTVQDGAITEPKLADKSVSLRTFADDTVHMLKGAILTGNLSGEVLTADDAYSAPPVALAIEGKSTQDGTPTPDAPVEIVSLEQAQLEFHGANMWGGAKLAADINASKPIRYGSNNHGDYFEFVQGGGIPAQHIYHPCPFKENTQYTIILAYENLRGTNSSTAMLVVYTDGTSREIHSPNTDGAYAQFAFVTAANKTVSYIQGVLRTVTSRFYYNNCGIFEGVHTVADFQPYDATNVLLNLTQALRSLPDGTHDTLSFAYLRPSTREGWAWYSQELVQRVDEYVFPDGFTFDPTPTDMGDGWYRFVRYGVISNISSNSSGLCDRFSYIPSGNMKSEHIYLSIGGATLLVTQMASVADANNAVIGATLLYLCTPVTTQLNPIELPILPAPDVTVWADPSTGLQMEYVRDSNIVIQNIEQAIADQ